MSPVLRLCFLLVFSFSTHAYAGEREQAEHTRLSEEMARLASRNAWRGVESSYLKMLELQRKGVVLRFEDHFTGAQAASNLGNITSTYRRASRALDAASSPEEEQQARAWVDEIEASYGPVDLRIPGRHAEPILFEIASMPFDPQQRAAYQNTRAQILEGESYQGLLPIGEYTFGSATFTVAANSDFESPQRIAYASDTGDSSGLIAFVGPRADLGGAMSSAGEPSGTNEPAAFSGSGLRAGLGLELGFRGGLGMLLEVGYHGINGGEGVDLSGVEVPGTGLSVSEAYGVQSTPTNLHAGYTWLAAAYRPVPALSIAAGPVYALGTGNAQGAGNEGDLASFASLSGQIRAGGGAGGVTYIAPFSLGPIGLGISAIGGAQSDSSRWYTWGQLALTITPAGSNG